MIQRAYPVTTWVEQRDYGHPVLLVPLGSLEQHGPHLPLNTDTLIAASLAERVAHEVDVDVAPAIPVGASGEHMGFPGLLSIGNEALEVVVLELLRSARATWQRVVIVSGHGGNFAALSRAASKARAEGSQVSVWFPTDVGGDPHAGATETSVMLALHPSVVDLRAAVDFPVSAEQMRQIQATGIMGVSASGVLGEPRRATASDGDAIVARWVREIIALVQEVEEK